MVFSELTGILSLLQNCLQYKSLVTIDANLTQRALQDYVRRARERKACKWMWFIAFICIATYYQSWPPCDCCNRTQWESIPIPEKIILAYRTLCACTLRFGSHCQPEENKQNVPNVQQRNRKQNEVASASLPRVGCTHSVCVGERFDTGQSTDLHSARQAAIPAEELVAVGRPVRVLCARLPRCNELVQRGRPSLAAHQLAAESTHARRPGGHSPPTAVHTRSE